MELREINYKFQRKTANEDDWLENFINNLGYARQKIQEAGESRITRYKL